MARSFFLFGALVLGTLAAPPASAQLPCTEGYAGAYPCEGLDLYAHIPLSEFGSSSGNDIWGWTDPETGREYALMGLREGTGIVDVTDPAHPAYLGKLPTATEPSVWRDIKVYEDHAFVVSEAPGHGMQIFDLTQLRGLTADPSRIFEANHTFVGPSDTPLGSAHNIVMNEASGYAYAVGAGECAGGLYMINVQDPMRPEFEGCFEADGYSHDAQCVMYDGPDEDHQGSEICIGSNEDTITIVDVTDKSNPVMLGKGTYPTPGYTHQGWLTEDHRYFIADDELDEIQGFASNTRTMIFDVTDLDSPELHGIYLSENTSSDHNLYVLGDRVYAANYTSGLRVLDLGRVEQGELSEVAAFDIYPSTDDAAFNGSWSVFPYFESGTVVISGIEGGLFVVRPSSTTALTLANFDAAADDGAVTVSWAPAASYSAPFTLQGRRAGEPFMELARIPASGPYRFRAEGLSPGRQEFRLVQFGPDGTIRVSETATAQISAPASYRLSSVFPNPARGTAQVALTVAEPQEVTAALYDSDGRHLKTVFQGAVEANVAQTFEVEGPGLPAGSYSLRVTGETFETSTVITRTP